MPQAIIRFEDRGEAGCLLAERIAKAALPSPCVVAGIPRGGIIVAEQIAECLGAPLSVLYARKMTLRPGSELAIGAVDEEGEMVLDPAMAPALRLTMGDLNEAKTRSLVELARQKALHGAVPLATLLPGYAVILVDDGLATGFTMRAALNFARRHGASHVTVAAPCCSLGAARRFEKEADALVSLDIDPEFLSVGQYYSRFPSISDRQIAAALRRARSHVVLRSTPDSGDRGDAATFSE